MCFTSTKIGILKIPSTYTLCAPDEACERKNAECAATIKTKQEHANRALNEVLKRLLAPSQVASSESQLPLTSVSMKRQAAFCKSPWVSDPESWECRHVTTAKCLTIAAGSFPTAAAAATAAAAMDAA